MCKSKPEILSYGSNEIAFSAIPFSGRSSKVTSALYRVIFRPLFGGVHLVDLFSELVDSFLMLLAVVGQLNVVLCLGFVQFSLQLRYFHLSPLRYLRLDG